MMFGPGVRIRGGVVLSLVAGGCAPSLGQSIQAVPLWPGAMYSAGAAVSSDGSTVVGDMGVPGSGHAFSWSTRGLIDLGVLPGAGSSGALAASATGTVVVGSSGGHAFRWINGVMQDLGVLPGA